MRQQCLRRFKKLPGVRQGCVQFKRSFVDPFGMDRKHRRLPNGLEYINGQATWFRARRSINPKQLFPKFRRFPWQRLESDDHVKGQKNASSSNYVNYDQSRAVHFDQPRYQRIPPQASDRPRLHVQLPSVFGTTRP
jgi:hypothetical protein